MGIETEIKLCVEDVEAFRSQLKELGAHALQPRHLEDNYVFDYPNQSLRLAKSLLRVRIVGTRGWLTYKGPSLPNAVFKIREELESEIEDGTLVLDILRRIGMKVWFRYQKYREEYSVAFGRDQETVLVALDETPVGTYVELEGSEQWIHKVARALGYNESDYSRESYYTLYLRSRQNQDGAGGSAEMIFETHASENRTENE